jgi:hypothetical protein
MVDMWIVVLAPSVKTIRGATFQPWSCILWSKGSFLLIFQVMVAIEK